MRISVRRLVGRTRVWVTRIAVGLRFFRLRQPVDFSQAGEARRRKLRRATFDLNRLEIRMMPAFAVLATTLLDQGDGWLSANTAGVSLQTGEVQVSVPLGSAPTAAPPPATDILPSEPEVDECGCGDTQEPPGVALVNPGPRSDVAFRVPGDTSNGSRIDIAYQRPSDGLPSYQILPEYAPRPGDPLAVPDVVRYSSARADARPVIETTVTASASDPVPTSIDLTLSIDGVAQSTKSFSTAGHTAGDSYYLSDQVATAFAATGAYAWSISAVFHFAGQPDATLADSGTSAVAVAPAAGAFGAGWSLAGVDRLTADALGDWVVLAGGDAGTRLFLDDGLGGFTSQAGDFGSLTYDSGTDLYTYTAYLGDEEVFDGGGRLLRTTDLHGLSTTYVYDGSVRLSEILGVDGFRTTLVYDGNDRVSTIVLPGGRRTTFNYSGGELVALVQPDASVRTFQYDAAHRLTADLGEDRTYATFAYDSVTGSATKIGMGPGRVSTLTSAAAQGLQTSTADAAGRSAVLVDPLNQTATLTLDPLGNFTGRTTADGSVLAWDRDSDGRLVRAADGLGRSTTYTYAPGTDDLVGVVYPAGETISFAYDSTWHRVASILESNHLHATPINQRATFSYDAVAGDPLTSVDPLGNVTTSTYSDGLLTSIEDPLGGLLTIAYDANRRIESITDPLDQTTTYTYHNHGPLRSIRDADNNVTSFAYDDLNRLATTTDPFQQTVTFYWSPWDIPEKKVERRGGDEVMTTWAYDATGRTLSKTEAAGTTIHPERRTSAVYYDSLHRVMATIDPLGATTTYLYDARNLVVAVIDPLGNRSTAVYDAAENLTAAVDPLGRRTTYSYDQVGRTTAVLDALGNRTTVVYDSAGNASATIDALNRRTTYLYDAADRVIGVQDPLGNRSTTVYDALGRVAAVVDPLNRRTSFHYDAIGQLLAVEDALGNRSTSVYDAVGNAVAAIDALGTRTTYAYDALHRLAAITDAQNFTTTFHYAASGRPDVVVPNQIVVAFVAEFGL